jgi:hypothetical protein
LHLVEAHGVSERRACRLAHLNLSTWQYRARRQAQSTLRERLVAARLPRQRRRGIAADEVVLERARRFLDPGFQPLVRRMIARGREMTTSDDRSEKH